MSASRAAGAAILTALAALALRALDKGEEARAVLSTGARDAASIARDSDLAPAAKAWNMPDDGGARNE